MRDTGVREEPPVIRAWLGGSAGSGKYTTLRTALQHCRLLFQKRNVDAKIELTAYTGVAAFNIGFGAKTAVSSFKIFPNAAFHAEFAGEAARKLEQQLANVVLLIVDEVSFIGGAFFVKMHFRMQQGRRRYFAEWAKDAAKYVFGGASIILVGDFGQLEPIDDISMCDEESRREYGPKKIHPLLKLARKSIHLLELFEEAFLLKQIHRSKEDTWWTESCLRLRDFKMTMDQDWKQWQKYDLDRGHFSEKQKGYFETTAVWLCARCEDVGSRNCR
jgi:hypothetical protein